ncbi:MAG: efflux RND transporter periplasmic adaptor subunit [Muribaculaceae bacterium]|nr:efflux RND transporter periplasmic adaptor subunit [Muribaculaceae bacterium]
MKKFLKITLWVIIALIFLGTFVYLFLNSRQKDAVYETVTPVVNDVERTTVLTGSIEPRDEIEIKPQVSGIIAEINVEPGDQVKEGDIIAKIKIIPDESMLASARNRVSVAQLDVDQRKLEYERTKALYDKKFESREKYEQDLNAYDKAVQELKAAQDNLSIVKEGVSKDNEQQSQTLVRATITGLVLEVPVKVGSSVIQANTMNDGTTIAKVADMSDLIFKGKIDETEVDMLSEGMPMHISIGAVSGSNLDAVIEKISPIATTDNGTNTFEIKAAIAVDSTMHLRAGYSANASVVLSRAAGALTVPERILEFSGDSVFVYLETDSVKHLYDRAPVKTGISDGINIQIIDSELTTESRLRGAQIK